MKVKNKLLATLVLFASINSSITYSQSWDLTGNPITAGDWLGTSNNLPLSIRTNSNERIHINPNGTTANSTNTSGFVGIGTNNPFSPLHIVGRQDANAAGWRRGITLSNDAILQWDAEGSNGLFMSHPSVNPDANWYAGINYDQTPTSAITYAFSIFVNDTLATSNPIGTTRFFKNVLISDNINERRLGINVVDPANVLEINTNATSPIPGNSGLRLTDLTTASNTIANPGDGVLSVDSNGDVIYVDAPLGSGFGNLCTDPSNPITGNYEVPLDEFNFHFTDPTGPLNQNENRVIIGQDCNALTPAKLNVYRDITQNAPLEVIAAQFVNSDLGFSDPFIGFSSGVLGIAEGPNRENYGVKGEAENATTNLGGKFISSTFYDGVNTGLLNYGVQGVASNGDVNYGVNGIASGENVNYGVKGSAFGAGALNYGVYGEASSSSGVTPPTGPNYAGFFDGDVVRTGTDNFTSDAALKSNVQNIGNALQIVNQLNPVNFEFDNTVHPPMHLANGVQYGFIAQDVEQILPELVKDEIFPPQFDSLGNVVSTQFDFKSLNYQAFIPILTKGMQEQQYTIDSLGNELAEKDSLLNDVNTRLTQLENCLSNLMPVLCQINNSAIQQNDVEAQKVLLHKINVELFDGENIILDQNIPNPFAERTVINYQIPASVGMAKLLFYNNEGRMIREVNISERGAGQVNVFGAELSKGTYSYTLFCDGKAIATKKMVKQ